MAYADKIALAREAALRSQAAAAPRAIPRGTSIVGDLLHQGDVALVQGAPQAGASAIALSMAAHLAGLADHWSGHPIPFRKARVLWIDARVDAGVGASLRAIEQLCGLDLTGRLQIERTRLLLASPASVVGLITGALGPSQRPPRALFLDDLGSCLQGLDQTRPEEAASKIIDALLRIQEGLGGLPLIVVDAFNGPLAGVADVVLTVTREGRRLTVTTSGRDVPPLYFELAAVRGAVVPVPADTCSTTRKDLP